MLNATVESQRQWQLYEEFRPRSAVRSADHRTAITAYIITYGFNKPTQGRWANRSLGPNAYQSNESTGLCSSSHYSVGTLHCIYKQFAKDEYELGKYWFEIGDIYVGMIATHASMAPDLQLGQSIKSVQAVRQYAERMPADCNCYKLHARSIKITLIETNIYNKHLTMKEGRKERASNSHNTTSSN